MSETTAATPSTAGLPATTAQINPRKLRVLDARLLVQMVLPSDRTEGGIWVPPKSQEDKAVSIAKVIRVGDGRTENGVRIPPRVKVDEVILLGKYAGTPVSKDGEYRIINEIEVLSIIEP